MSKIDTRWIREDEPLLDAALALRAGQLVAFPTETVYGLGADALNEDAVRAIYTAKGRPSDNPLIVHVYPGFDLERVVRQVPVKAQKLMDAFWPGPLTLIMPRRENVPYATTGGLETVGVRMPSHPKAMELLRLADVPVAAPSANRSGRPSPTTAAHVWEDMQGRIYGIVDGGPCTVGLESTIIDMTGDVPMLLRPGGITLEMLRSVIGEVAVEPSVAKGLAISKEEHPRAPGMKYRHYAPKGSLVLLRGSDASKTRYLKAHLPEVQGKAGVLASSEWIRQMQQVLDVSELHIEDLGSRTQPDTMARRLFGALRSFDENGCTDIFGEALQEDGLFMAMMNRMRRAAAGVILPVDPVE
ncbi:MAG: threonylcarbamoyl-AMP synthase [Clostridiales bacterium]|nr:threonylcarbamoyl-AMP synthase [Clostridiales bacterium]